MSILNVADSKEKAKTEEANNRLGISRAVYAVGYSFRDAFIWFGASTVALSGLLYAMRHTRPVEVILEKFGAHENSWRTRFAKKYPSVGPIVLVSMTLGWISSHFVQIPSSAKGWSKAEEAIQKYNRLAAEKDQLVIANTELKTELDETKKERADSLPAAEKKPIPHTERVLAQAPEAAVAQSR